MKNLSVLPLSLAFLAGLLVPTQLEANQHWFAPNDNRAVELASIQSLLFRKDSRTTGRRTAPVAQLSCIEGGACGTQFEPTVVHCTNIGTDYSTGDPNWKCTAELENGLRLGTTDVVCEGFRDRDDPYILRGSCGLEYTLLGTPVRSSQQFQGAQQHQRNQPHYQQTYGVDQNSYKSYSKSSSKGSWVNWIVGAFLIWMFLRYISRSAGNAFRTAASVDGIGGGGGYFGGYNPGRWNWGNWGNLGGWRNWGNGWGNGWGYGEKWGRPNDAHAGTGFWQGLGLGAGAGYLFGARNNHNNNSGWHQPREAYVPPTYSTRTYERDHTYDRPTAQAPAGPATAQAPAGPATQTATGYGSTRRRG